MGMYTEIYIRCSLKKETPDSVISALKCCVGDLEECDVDWSSPELTKAEDLFSKDSRGRRLLNSGSFYHQPNPTTNFWQESVTGTWYLCSRSDIKNYAGEIEQFFDWIKPYLEEQNGQFIGYHIYEEFMSRPVLVFANGG